MVKEKAIKKVLFWRGGFKNQESGVSCLKIIAYPITGTCSIFIKTICLRIISKKTLKEFWQKHSDCEQQLKAWYQETNRTAWKNSVQIKKAYPTASFLSNNRVVINIKGNNYRLILKINYDYQIVWIRFIGTHAEYDKIDATKI